MYWLNSMIYESVLWLQMDISTRAPIQYKDAVLPVYEIPLWR